MSPELDEFVASVERAWVAHRTGRILGSYLRLIERRVARQADWLDAHGIGSELGNVRQVVDIPEEVNGSPVATADQPSALQSSTNLIEYSPNEC